jgi:chitodextrinase
MSGARDLFVGEHMRMTPRRRWVPLVVIALTLGGVALVGHDSPVVSPVLAPVSHTIVIPADQASVSARAALTPDAGSLSGSVVRFADEATPTPSGFVHPGILMDRDQLDYVKAQLALGNQPWTDALAKAETQKKLVGRLPHLTALLRVGNTALKCDPSNPGAGCIVNCGSSSNPNDGCTDENVDFEAAYTQALLWYLTNDETYAQSAIAIMNAWSAVLKDHTGVGGPLQAAWSAESVTRAAELLRYTYTPSAGKTPLDVPAFTTMLNTAFRPVLTNSTQFATSNGNWDFAGADALMNIAVFTDDHPLFDEAVRRWRARLPAYIYRTSDGPLPVAPPGGALTGKSQLTCFWLNSAPNCAKTTTVFKDGQAQETCRDTSHVAMGFASLFDAAETAHVQGVDLYSDQKDRLAAGLENVTHLINTVTNVSQYPADFCVGHGTLQPPLLEPTFEIAYNALANREGMSLPDTLATVKRLRAPSVVSVNRMMGFETLTHADTGNSCGTPANRFGKAYLGTTVPDAGDYRVWARVKSSQDSAGSLALQVDGGCPATLALDGSSAGQWTWVNTTAGDAGQPLTRSLSAGKHLFTVTPGDSGVAVDQVLVTDDPDCVPTEQGCLPPVADTSSPTQPGAPAADSLTDTSVSLSWAPSTDDRAVLRYRISRNGAVVGTSTDPRFTDRGLTPETAYSYTVDAVDAAGNASPASEPLSATTAPTTDTGPPSAPAGLTSSGVTSNSASLSWVPSTDDGLVDHYTVIRDGVAIADTPSASFADTGLAASSAYVYTVVAVDAVGNVSDASDPLSVTTQPPPGPPPPPSAPTALTATDVTDSTVSLSWTAPTGAQAVDHYLVLRGGTPVNTTGGTTYTDRGLQATTGYSYSVVAVDARGGTSPPSNAVSVTTTAAPDRTAPSAPGSLAAQVSGLGQVSVSWTSSTDNVGVTGYRLSRNGSPLGTQAGTGYADSGLSPGTTYTYTVTALDAAGNASAASTALVTTPLDTAPLGAGFAGAYFNNTTLSGPAIGRLDPTVNFAWGSGSPMPGISPDKFSARWTGQLTPTKTGTYTFYTQGDNGARLYLNDKPVIDTWNTVNASASGTASLTAGTSYNLRVEFFEGTGAATMKLQWSGPGIAKAVLPATVMTSASRGLSGAYFANTALSGAPTLQRLDSAINFSWGSAAPDSRLPTNNFGAQWTGKLTAPATAAYTISTDSDDGVRVWINNQLVIDNWSATGLTTKSVKLNLVAKSVYDIRVAYQEKTSTATAKLSWAYGTTAKTIIPTTALRDR